MKKKLSEILTLLKDFKINDESKDIYIENIEHDSRKITPNSLFVCIKGTVSNGSDFIQMAVDKGAVCVLSQEDEKVPEGIIKIIVPNVHQALEKIVPAFYDYPARKMRIIGVTGTNGKTTTTYMLKEIFEKASYKTGVIGTIKIMIGEKIYPINNTTPDIIDLQRILWKMAEEKVDYVLMEVSSHALSLNRVSGCEFDVAVFTNLTRDHLDFHKTFENYALAKAKLFSSLSNNDNKKERKTAIINLDDCASKVMLEHTKTDVITYGIKKDANILAKNINIHAGGMEIDLTGKVKENLNLKITGLFNVYNILAAVSTGIAENIDIKYIKEALEKFKGVSGRFELVKADEKQDFSVIVDYAHTPDGLENILNTAKEIAKAKIITVFGCGGDRDKTKRPIMGKIAAQLSDIVIATSDNPRTENPETILDEVEIGVKQGLHGNQHEKIVDRRLAIKFAIDLAKKDDIIIIAGKGHEDYQILNTGKIHFDDKEEATKAILNKLSI